MQPANADMDQDYREVERMTEPLSVCTVADVRAAAGVLERYLSPTPLCRSTALERELGLPSDRRAWLKDYGWTPVGSFKVLGALHWMAKNAERIGSRPVAAHSSGNFASGLAFAGMCFGKRVVIVMPETAPTVKFRLTRSFGAEVRTYDITTDHMTGVRNRMTRSNAEDEGGMEASPYDDNDVIAGNGVGGLEIARELMAAGRTSSHFVCPVSGGGLMAGHALAIRDAFPNAAIVGVEPEAADDFRRSLETGARVRLEHPTSICDGLLSYDVGRCNWPILRTHVSYSVAVPDDQTCRAMRWLWEHHGLRSEPSGAIALAAVLEKRLDLSGAGDVVLVVSGRNVDDDRFRAWIADS
jgi:threonine dehydratase